MHELALMAGVFDIVKKYTAELPDKKVTRVTLVVGELTNAVPEALESSFQVYAKGTNVEGAELIVRRIPLTALCVECRWEGKVEEYTFICPKCSGLGLEIKTGRELYVESMEVE